MRSCASGRGSEGSGPDTATQRCCPCKGASHPGQKGQRFYLWVPAGSIEEAHVPGDLAQCQVAFFMEIFGTCCLDSYPGFKFLVSQIPGLLKSSPSHFQDQATCMPGQCYSLLGGTSACLNELLILPQPSLPWFTATQVPARQMPFRRMESVDTFCWGWERGHKDGGDSWL